jgi:polar amino acid transport system substrate-binding protein
VIKLPLALLLLALSHITLADERPIRFAIMDSWTMPMVSIEHGQAVEGILVDLQQRMAAKIGRKAELLVMPRLRVQEALEIGDIDVRCYVNPSWINSGHYRYIWSLASLKHFSPNNFITNA